MGVCDSWALGQCVTDANPAVSTPVTNCVTSTRTPRAIALARGGNRPRTLVGSLSHGGLGCYDWSTMAPCTGGAYRATAGSRRLSGHSLPSAYGAAYDGACAVGLGDPGRVFTVDPAGSSPCLSLASGADRTRVDLRDQRCDGTVGAASWGTWPSRTRRQGDADGRRHGARREHGEVLSRAT